MVLCPVCSKPVKDSYINEHLDSGCTSHLIADDVVLPSSTAKPNSFFNRLSTQKPTVKVEAPSPTQQINGIKTPNGLKRPFEESDAVLPKQDASPNSKRAKLRALHDDAPLAERMRPLTLDDVVGQELVGPNGVIRGLIKENRVPSMILWGGSGTGKTTIARLIAHTAGARFVEINSTSSGVGECKRIFSESHSERLLTGRKTIVFCDEIHRFNKAQQDVFLGPVESGQITLIGATTENPSFKVVNALLSRCRTFTLAKLTDETIVQIMERALKSECGDEKPPPLLDNDFFTYLALFSDGDARTALNLLELALNLSKRPEMTSDILKKSLTHTLVYDRAGDQHYDTISAFHKSIRGSDPDAALYYLARMLQSGEDPLYIARRLTVVASEDIGLADNTMLSLATATYSACEKIGMPECRINLAHATVAFALSKKSTRIYRGLGAAMAALSEPGIAGLPIPIHMRNAPTKLMKELGYGKDYKYNPDYLDGRVVQDYLPEKLLSRKFLEDQDLGTRVDPDIEHGNEEDEDELPVAREEYDGAVDVDHAVGEAQDELDGVAFSEHG
jgi:putative ATPase